MSFSGTYLALDYNQSSAVFTTRSHGGCDRG